MVRVQEVKKSFASLQVLRGISFSMQPAEYTVLLGQNGAGKTTLVRIMASLMRATSGTINIKGFDLPKQANQLRRHMGVVSHDPFLYGDLSAEENLRFYGKLYDLTDLSAHINRVLEQVNLLPRRLDLARNFSRGMQQRLSLARALLHQPDLLLLDEPFSGLDYKSSLNLAELLRQLNDDGTTILMTTHDLDFALANSKRILLLKNGTLVKDTPVGDTSRQELIDLFG